MASLWRAVLRINLQNKFVSNPMTKCCSPTCAALPHLELVRGRKRTCRPAPWFVRKKNSLKHLQTVDITGVNKQFLQDVVQERLSPDKKRDSPLKEEPWPRNPWTLRTNRTGVLAVKIGCFPYWKKDGCKLYTTLLQVMDNHVIRYIPPEQFANREGWNPKWGRYGSVVVGALSCDPVAFTEGYNSLFKEAGVPPKRKLTRFLVTPDAAIQPGTPLYATHFKVGDYVDVQAKTIGHGFQGVVKRWGFKGGPASHGSTKFHRRPGSIGSGRKCARVRPGKKMPGHMGMDWRHLRGLKIWKIDTRYNVLYVNGPMLPGPTHCYTRVMDTVLPLKRVEMSKDPLPMPTFFPDLDAPQGLPEEIWHPDIARPDQPSIVFQEAAPSGAAKKKVKAGQRK